MKTNLEVFYYLVDKECNKSIAYSANMYTPEVIYLAKKFGISNKKAQKYILDWKKELNESNV